MDLEQEQYSELANYTLLRLYQSGTPNPLITWEVGNVYNVGFESRFFENKMKLEAEYFYQRRNNILVKRNASVPAFTGISLPDENFGIVDNKGFELTFGYADRKADWSVLSEWEYRLC